MAVEKKKRLALHAEKDSPRMLAIPNLLPKKEEIHK